ncbi:nrm1-like protein [Ophiostoma piceae UAMH 11346]|uniref:Nrm1-like protein n=1 Tax=Ophiostoma piceae (strain UAMH 11346) TaxID=1262450 RepID=S3CAV7_OPHP1|nr:nrm1-like protein [Ophiostoma piceae UAMH 11346]
MIASTSMSSTTTTTLTIQPDVVADRVLRRAELGKMASRLQNRLALAQFKTRHGWEDLTLDMIEPKVEDEIRRKRSDGDVLSDSSSSTSDHPYSASRTLMSSPLKPPMFSDAVGSSSGSSGHRKRTYVASFDDLNNDPYNNNNSYQLHGSGRRVTYMMSSPSKRYRSSPPPSRHVSNPLISHQQQQNHHNQRSASYMPAPPPQQPTFAGHAAWKDHHQLSHSSPIKPKRHQHFTTAAGPDVSLFHGARRIADVLTNTNYNAPQSDEDDDELLPTHSFRNGMSFGGPSITSAGLPAGLASSASLSGSMHATRSGSPPSTPPMRTRGLPSGNAHGNANNGGGRRKKKAANMASGHDMMMDDDSEGSHTGLGIDQVEGRDINTSNVIPSEHNGNGKSGVEGADLLLFLAASPSPANPSGRPLLGGSSSSRMDPPSTPPSKFNNLALPSSMMTTPGGGSMFPQTPGQAFDFADFVNITPSPAQKPWKTPNLMGSKTPLSVTRRRLTFDDM